MVRVTLFAEKLPGLVTLRAKPKKPDREAT
jgi:hypothetical protein